MRDADRVPPSDGLAELRAEMLAATTTADRRRLLDRELKRSGLTQTQLATIASRATGRSAGSLRPQASRPLSGSATISRDTWADLVLAAWSGA